MGRDAVITVRDAVTMGEGCSHHGEGCCYHGKGCSHHEGGVRSPWVMQSPRGGVQLPWGSVTIGTFNYKRGVCFTSSDPDTYLSI